MDTDLEGAIVLAKLRDEFKDRMLNAEELGELMRRECPDWSDEQAEVLLKDASKRGNGLLSFGELIDFLLEEAPVVLASPPLESLAAGLRRRFGVSGEELLKWEHFASGDASTRFQWRQLVGRRVVFLFDTVNQGFLFEQLSLLQALQGFPVPDGADCETRWKTYGAAGKYSWGRPSEIIVVIPWYRPCQMERVSRWKRVDGKEWTNKEQDGEWLDVPAAQTLVRLLATPGPPPPGPLPEVALDGKPLEPLWRPPLRLLFFELHEEAPVRRAAEGLGLEVRSERLVPYFARRFKANPAYEGPASTYVLFPDHGAYNRYASTMLAELGLALDHVLWMNKKRSGGTIEQQKLLFFHEQGGGESQKASFKPTDHVLIIDDFTNTGGTLFGAVNLVRSLASGDEPLQTSIFVSHTVASYDEGVLDGLLAKLEELGSRCRYFTTDTLPASAKALKGHPQVEVIPIVDFLASLLK